MLLLLLGASLSAVFLCEGLKVAVVATCHLRGHGEEDAAAASALAAHPNARAILRLLQVYL